MVSTGSIDLLPAQYDTDGNLVAHPARVVRFLDVEVMIQRSAIDGKTLVTVSGDHRDVRIDLNDGTVWDGPPETPAPAPVVHRGNIADNPAAIAAHLAGPYASKTEYGQRVSQLHLRDVGDGYWSRLRLVTVRENRECVSTLILDHHRDARHGQEGVRAIPDAEFTVRSTDATGAITAHLFEQAHAAAAAVLVAYPEAIAHLLERHAK